MGVGRPVAGGISGRTGQTQNNKLTWPLNMVTEMYSLPAYDGVDPEPLMAPFSFCSTA